MQQVKRDALLLALARIADKFEGRGLGVAGRLIVMLLGGLDDGDAQMARAAAQDRRHG